MLRSTLLLWPLVGLAACATPATVLPVPSAENRAAAAGWGSGTWMDQHAAICRIGRDGASAPPDLIFLGDSITQSWGGPGRAVHEAAPVVWQERYANRRAANFGIAGDRTQHLLWRLQNGALDGLQPKAIVILIGTNNVGTDAPADVARAGRAINAALGGAAFDLEPQFTLPDGSLRAELFGGDGLHLSPAGYAAWAAAIEPWIAGALGEVPR